MLSIRTVYLTLVGLWRPFFFSSRTVHQAFSIPPVSRYAARLVLMFRACQEINYSTFFYGWGWMNVAQLSQGNIFAMWSALLQACLGCYNNSCCYICHCSGSWLAKRAIYITSLSDCQSFSLSLPVDSVFLALRPALLELSSFTLGESFFFTVFFRVFSLSISW